MPGNVYRTRDGRHASIAASTQSIFERLIVALGVPELARDGRSVDNKARVDNRDALDAEIARAIDRFTLDELRERLNLHEVGFSPINDIADVFADPHLQARDAIVEVPDAELGSVRMQGVVPRFSATPGRVREAGPALGAHTDGVLAALGYTETDRARLRERRVI